MMIKITILLPIVLLATYSLNASTFKDILPNERPAGAQIPNVTTQIEEWETIHAEVRGRKALSTDHCPELASKAMQLYQYVGAHLASDLEKSALLDAFYQEDKSHFDDNNIQFSIF